MEPHAPDTAGFDPTEQVFVAAMNLPPAEREAIIAARLGHDPAAQSEARRLLEAHDRNGPDFLARPILGEGFSVLNAATQEPEPVPERIGQYNIVRLLSEGDASLVYLAEHDGPVPLRVAIKVLRSGASRREVLRRFELERRVVALMDHPSIAHFHEAGSTADGRAYFVMEYVEGRPITEHARLATLTPTQKLTLMVEVCLAVEHAHQRGVIHRDLKPSNILVTDDQRVKVIDFGIARARFGAEGLTLDGQIIGTPAYISPEQLRGAATDTRADVYSLGVVLYELLDGTLPFDLGHAPAAAVGIVLAKPPRPLRAPGSPRDARAVVEMAMNREPEGRYPTVAEFRADLQRLLSGRPVSAKRHGVFYVGRRFIGRNRVAALVTGLAVLVGVGGLWQARQADRQRVTLAIDVAEALLRQSVDIAKKLGDRGRRRPLVEELERVAADLANLAPDDPRVMNLQAMVCAAVCDLEQQEGRLEKAAAAGDEALRIRRRLAALQPHSPQARINLSIAIVRTGDIAYSRRDQAAAERAYAQAHEIDLKLAQEHPSDPRVISVLGWSYDRLGTFAGFRDDVDSNARFRALQLRTFEDLLKLDTSVDVYRALSEAHHHLGRLANARSDLQAWHHHAEQAVAFARIAVEQDPTDRLAIGVLVVTESGRWDAMFGATGSLPSREEVDRILATARAAAAADPWDAPATHRVGLTYHAAMKAAQRWGDQTAAAEYAASAQGGLPGLPAEHTDTTPPD